MWKVCEVDFSYAFEMTMWWKIVSADKILVAKLFLMWNENLHKAKSLKNDEFYTQYADIQNEINAYLEFNPDVFRWKTILLPCDDPEWSNFTKFFAQNFENFGLKKLISTSYAVESKNLKIDYQPTLFEIESPRFDKNKTRTHWKIFVLDHDTNNNGKIDIEDLQWKYLEWDGDFRSDEIKKLRDEADIIITNPPFSLFRDFFKRIIQANKKFIIIGSINSLNFWELFSKIKNNEAWLWNWFSHWNAYFSVPSLDVEYADGVYDKEKWLVKFRNCCWFTNLDHWRRHYPLNLMTFDDNLKYSKHKDIKEKWYIKYFNYEAIDIPYIESIPSDYDWIMWVPISFLDKYCPEQFEIIWKWSDVEKTMIHTVIWNEIHFLKNWESVRKTQYTVKERKAWNSLRLNDNWLPWAIPYARILIRHKR